jgi:CheY-like chemotaxis protein
MSGATRANLTRVLIVEDNADLSDGLATLLRAAGHTVAVEHEAGGALVRARLFRPDVVLADIGLPGTMDGYELARTLRSDPDLGHCYLVALTGYAYPKDVAKAREAGFDEHMAKPADIAAILNVIARAWLPQPASRASTFSETSRERGRRVEPQE